MESLVILLDPSFLSHQPRKDLEKKTKLAFVQVLVDSDSDEVIKNFKLNMDPYMARA